MESFKHASIANKCKVGIEFMESEKIKDTDINKLDGILVPGVFGYRGLEGKVEAIRYSRENKIPFLGICLGLQVLFSESEEHGRCKGLDIIPGKVKKFAPGLKIPHMGWNSIKFKKQTGKGKIFAGITNGAYFYFVHSYYVVPRDEEVVAVEADYHRPFCAMIWRDNLFATQFHPEKSQADGLRILKNFAELG